MNRLKPLLPPGLLLAGLFAVAVGGQPKGGAAAGQEYEVQTGDQKYTIVIALDRIGVFSKPDPDPAEWEQFLDRLDSRYGLKPVKDEGGGLMHVFRLKNPEKEAAALLALARKVKGEGPVVEQAGLVVRLKGGKSLWFLTDEFLVQFAPQADLEAIAKLNAKYGVERISASPADKRLMVLRVTDRTTVGLLELLRLYLKEKELVRLVEPNFVFGVKLQGPPAPTDPPSEEQWHHRSTRTPQAWPITEGQDVTIAVIDGGFDTRHPDLAGALWENPGETGPGRRDDVDDDRNGYRDDIHGWNFLRNNHVFGHDRSRSDRSRQLVRHGTSVAGLVGARRNGQYGVGICPRCKLMLLAGGEEITLGSAVFTFDYAVAMGADVINCSWSYDVDHVLGSPPEWRTFSQLEQAVRRAVNDGRGRVVVFATGNSEGLDYSDGRRSSLASLPGVLAAGRSTCEERRDLSSGFGRRLSLVLAPGAGITTITSDQRRDEQGLARAVYVDHGFQGGSAAAPQVSGAAGLVLAANSRLSGEQVVRILQDTADKIDATAAQYSPATGRSEQYGYGRLNVAEAVRLAARTAGRGRDGVDAFVRDHRLDWGNADPLPDAPPHWEGVDIKVDAYPFQRTPPGAATFDAFPDEPPVPGEENRVYVRVRNRGPETATRVNVRLYWAPAGLAAPALPARWEDPETDFRGTRWTRTEPQELRALAYSGCCATDTESTTAVSRRPQMRDAAQVARFTFRPGDVRHCCFLVVLDTAGDPLADASTASRVPDEFAPRDNNVALRNVALVNTGSARSVSETVLLRNPTGGILRARLGVRSPTGCVVTRADGVGLNEEIVLDRPGEEVSVRLNITLPGVGQTHDVTITQEQRDRDRRWAVLGGMTFRFRPRP
jgi:subtilisin family serine protease